MMPADDSFVITGIGMRCAVGQDAALSCAAIRGGISRLSEWPHMVDPTSDDENSVVGANVVPDPGDSPWPDKFEDLATQPLLESLWMAGMSQVATTGDNTRWGIFLAVPPFDRPGVEQSASEKFMEDVRTNSLFPVRPLSMACQSNGHAGGLLAIDSAMKELLEDRLDICVVGGADSLLESEYLSWLLTEGRLKSERIPAGLIPGEAAAFVVLERGEHARKRGAEILACIHPIRAAFENSPVFGDDPSRGDSMAQVLRETLSDAPCPASSIHRIINDLNGERWRFMEWAMAEGRALVQLPPYRRLWHPADCFGDIGAATGAAHLCMAVSSFRRNYAVGDAILICNASDSGERAATTVYSPELIR